MSILKSLKLAAVTQARVASSEFAFRDKLLRYLHEQKVMAEAELAGAPFQPTKLVTRIDEAGQKVRVEAPRTIRKGWFTDEGGKLFFQLRYGAKPLELAKGVNAVEVADRQALPATIGTVIEAVKAGELDAQLKTAIAERKAGFKPRTKKAAA